MKQSEQRWISSTETASSQLYAQVCQVELAFECNILSWHQY